MKRIEWFKDCIKIEPPKATKKVTGTRFGAVLGLNPWVSQFETWCAITKTYEEPFEDTKYTLAGKAIEPKQAEYVEKSIGLELISPTDKYGKNYFNKTHGDFFHDNAIFGGMWDFLSVDDNGNVDAVLEMKTTKRIEDWEDDIPEYYALQAALYAYLLGVDDVIMVASFLQDADYDHPDKYEPSINNTVTREFKVSQRYPNFDSLVNMVENWWKHHVETGISPSFDEKKDKDILKVLRTNSLAPDTDIQEFVVEGEKLKEEIDAAHAQIADKEKRLKTINGLIKDYATDNLRDGDTKVEVAGSAYKWVLTRTKKEKTVLDEDRLKADGLYEKYSKTITDTAYRMTVTEV